jgi:hypothetical protein
LQRAAQHLEKFATGRTALGKICNGPHSTWKNLQRAAQHLEKFATGRTALGKICNGPHSTWKNFRNSHVGGVIRNSPVGGRRVKSAIEIESHLQ